MLENIDFAGIASHIISYAQSLVSGSLAGDPMSVAISAAIIIVILAVVFKVSGFLFGVVKRLFLLIVIVISAYYFFSNYGAEILSGQAPAQVIIVGLIGALFAIAALVISIFSFKRHTVHAKAPSAPPFAPTQLQHPQVFTTQALTKDNLVASLKDDRSILAVLSYVIIAQFGVFSSKTISAPNSTVGMAFFVIFLLGALIFIRTTYHSYLKGVSHLLIACFVGFVISVGLGYFWGEIPLATLLSTAYFTTDAMVAFVTGIAVSLLMGTKS